MPLTFHLEYQEKLTIELLIQWFDYFVLEPGLLHDELLDIEVMAKRVWSIPPRNFPHKYTFWKLWAILLEEIVVDLVLDEFLHTLAANLMKKKNSWNEMLLFDLVFFFKNSAIGKNYVQANLIIKYYNFLLISWCCKWSVFTFMRY